jgi:pilus assembly protein FimV
LIAKSHHWKKTAVAAAAIALLGLSTSGAWALSLGRITVQSALGEPLRAEIDVPEINAEEAASLKAGIAPATAFAAAGLDYNPALVGLQATLQRHPDGRAFIRLSSDRPVNDPFVDMIVEASWSSGRVLRDYTLLFDPPVLRKPAPATPTLAQTQTQPPTQSANARAAATAPAAEPSRAAQPPRPAVVGSSPVTQTAPAGQSVVVKPGDTAGKIAVKAKPAEVSFDQMLVALMRANPDAFIKGNMNRIRAGAVMELPTSEQAQAVSAAEATQIVIAQSKDFNEFRRSLASGAPLAAVDPATRKAGGSIDTKVEDKKTATVTPDKLTLSKGAIQSKANEAKIAKDRADKAAADRAAEIAKNIADLKKLSTPAVAPPPAPAVLASQPKAAPASVPAIAVAAAAPPSTPAAPPAVPASALPASAPVSVPAPAATAASAPAASAPVKAVVAAKPAPEPVEPPGFIDELLQDPMVPVAAGGLIALLGGLAFWRARQRKKRQSDMDSSFLESRLQPDSFFGASGGQRIDTNSDHSATGSSMVYSASQLDAADDVDPVAEADVYLAYGRDIQAEEILREAVRTTPGRLAIHTKLLEIYAKRRDARNFEAAARQAFTLTGAGNPEWQRICEMGLAFDPSNPLYQPGGTPDSTAAPSGAAAASVFGSTIPQSAHAELGESVGGVDLDLDLDFSLDEAPSSASGELTSEPAAVPQADQTVKMPAVDLNAPLDMDFDLPIEPAAPSPMPDLSLSLDEPEDTGASSAAMPDFTATSSQSAPAAEPAASALDSGMLEFDIGSLSLDLEPTTESPTDAPDSKGEDPLETKLALAEEFVSIGDEDGARALIEEVVSESTGEMRARAQRALANLS